jgi:hypothetical protein
MSAYLFLATESSMAEPHISEVGRFTHRKEQNEDWEKSDD